jgi:hypothetical protein
MEPPPYPPVAVVPTATIAGGLTFPELLTFASLLL